MNTTLESLADRIYFDDSALFRARSALKHGPEKKIAYSEAHGASMSEIATAITQNVAIYADMGETKHLTCILKANSNLGKPGNQIDLWFALTEHEPKGPSDRKNEIGPVCIAPLQQFCTIASCQYTPDGAARLVANALKDNATLETMHKRCGSCITTAK
jgi:hypothetical protein